LCLTLRARGNRWLVNDSHSSVFFGVGGMRVAGALVLFTLLIGTNGSAHWVASLPVPERSRPQSQCLLVNHIEPCMHKAGNIPWANGWAVRDRPNLRTSVFAPGRRGNNKGKTAKGRRQEKERGLRLSQLIPVREPAKAHP